MADPIAREDIERVLAELEQHSEGIDRGILYEKGVALGIGHAVSYLRTRLLGCHVRLGDGSTKA